MVPPRGSNLNQLTPKPRVDFPDAITGGLRRRTDTVRGVLERTRGDLTNSLRRQYLADAISRLEARLDPDADG